MLDTQLKKPPCQHTGDSSSFSGCAVWLKTRLLMNMSTYQVYVRTGEKRGENRARDFTICTAMKNSEKCTLLCNFPFRFMSPGYQTSPVFWAVSINGKVHRTHTPWANKCRYGNKNNLPLSLFPFLYHLLLCYAFRCVECLHCLCHLLLCVFLCYDFYRSVAF